MMTIGHGVNQQFRGPPRRRHGARRGRVMLIGILPSLLAPLIV
jgi:hypothetical protein